MNFTQESVELNLTCITDCPVKEANNFQICLLVLGILGLVLNTLAIRHFWFSPTPPTKWTLTNLFTGSIFALSFAFFKGLKDLGYFKLGDPISCRNWGYFERIPVALLPATMLALFFESMNHAKVYKDPKRSKKIAIYVYAMALVISIPGFFNHKITYGSGEFENVKSCWKIFFADWRAGNVDLFWNFDLRQLQIIYETVFTFGISLPPSFFMILFLQEAGIRNEMTRLYLFKRVPRGIKLQVSQIRWAMCYTLFYHIFYFFPSLVLYCLTIWSYFEDVGSWNGNWIGDPQNSNLARDCALAMNFLLVVFHPLFFIPLGSVGVGQKFRFCHRVADENVEYFV